MSAGGGKIIKLDEGQLREHLDRKIVESVETTLNQLLDAEADRICQAGRYERSPDRVDTRAGHYERGLHTKAGEVTLKVPKLRKLPFETQIIERYRRKESSVEEALMVPRNEVTTSLDPKGEDNVFGRGQCQAG